MSSAQFASGATGNSPDDIGPAFRLGMRQLAAGVSLITAAEDGARYGLAVTSVTSLSAEPPMLLVCVNQGASAHEAILRSGRFGVNVLAHEDIGVAQSFADPARRAERFASGEWSSEEGPPRLLSALAAFMCTVVDRHVYASHSIFIGLVDSVFVRHDGSEPLVYFERAYRTLR